MKKYSLLPILLLATMSQAQIVPNQVDRFTSGIELWLGATPQWVSTGGFENDGFLSLTSTGGSGSQSKMAARNTAQWSGNYTAAGVGSVSAEFKNFGNTNLEMRLVLFSQNGSQWVSNSSVVLLAGSGWTLGSFNLIEAQMTRTSGTSTFADTMLNAQQLMFRHDPGAPSNGGVSIAANLGIDNVSANPVPEPASLAVLGLGGLLASRKRRRN